MKKLLCIIFISVFINNSLLADDEKIADCIILEDENSIICKYTHQRVSYEKSVTFNWIEPDGKITRTKVMIIPAGHGSVYDYRYIKGRTIGKWTFKVTDDSKEFQTNFTIE